MANFQVLPQATIVRERGGRLVAKMPYHGRVYTVSLSEGNCAAIVAWTRRIGGSQSDQAGNRHILVPYWGRAYHAIVSVGTAQEILLRAGRYTERVARRAKVVAKGIVQPVLL